jgi:hypothetical protein
MVPKDLRIKDGTADIDTLLWASLRFSHTTAIRAALPGR